MLKKFFSIICLQLLRSFGATAAALAGAASYLGPAMHYRTRKCSSLLPLIMPRALRPSLASRSYIPASSSLYIPSCAPVGVKAWLLSLYNDPDLLLWSRQLQSMQKTQLCEADWMSADDTGSRSLTADDMSSFRTVFNRIASALLCGGHEALSPSPVTGQGWS